MTSTISTSALGPVLTEATRADGVHVVAATAGFSSYLLIWGAVMWGMFLRNGWVYHRVRHSTLYSTHMGLGLMGLALGTLHGFAQTAAPVAVTTLRDVFVPFLNLDHYAWGDLPYLVRMGEGIGTLCLELMVAATAATWFREKLGANRWRAFHMINYAGYLLMVAHIFISGSDMGHGWAWGMVLVTTTITVVTMAWTTNWGAAMRRRGESSLNIAKPGARLSVEVDALACVRFGFCEHEAPEVFQLTGDGRLTYDASVPIESADGAVRAARVCPARAIRLGQEADQVVMGPAQTPAAGMSGVTPIGRERLNRGVRS